MEQSKFDKHKDKRIKELADRRRKLGLRKPRPNMFSK